jgi:acyl transferase domain-containing protein/acyl carrier protein
MSELRDTVDRKALLQRAYSKIEEQQVRISALEARLAPQRLAIVGLSCRFPGAGDPDSFWELLRTGTDAIGRMPSDRWNVEGLYDPDPDAPGRMYTRHGGFLGDVASFDAAFFGISPREALAMDPQQRLLLETTWEALDRAGQPRDRLAGSSTGVFIGITANEYAQLQPDGLSGIDVYHITGNTLNAAAGRIAYTLGFRGPAIAVDTACSSSLVAVHLACAAIRQGDCEQAIAGGVHLILSPAGHVALSRARVLSPGGRCRTFDAAADGMARGEGCGVIVIRKLSDALRDGDPIVALIRGSAVNQDGPSGGLTVPNGAAQEDVIRRAVAQARVEPRQVGYVEAHGTATPLGDPIEIAALAGALGDGRAADAPLLVGSVKTNLGHMEAAAGIAGLIKVALALEHGEIPAHLHFATPSPQIPWSTLPISIVTQPRPWPRGAAPRIAGVSAFGFSGTNAHVVLEEAPPPVTAAPDVGAAFRRPDVDAPFVMRVAARSENAFRQLAERYAAHIEGHDEQALADVCATANTGRGDGAERGAVVASTRAELVAGLTMLARGESGPGVFRGRSTERRRMDIGLAGIADPRTRLERIAAAYVSGVLVDWAAIDGGAPRRRVVLPTYPWQRQRFWPERPVSQPVPAAAVAEASDPCAGWTYEIVWRELDAGAPQVSSAPLPAGNAIERHVEPYLRAVRADAETARYAEALDRLEQRAAARAARALAQMGGDPERGVMDVYRPLLRRMGEMVEDAGSIDDTESLDALVARYPAAEHEFRILERCTEALPDVVRGQRDPLEVLFPADGAISVAHLYGESLAARLMNGVLDQVFRLVSRDAPSPLRVIEIGSGTGGTTASILSALKAAALQPDYLFTDVSPVFLSQARARFPETPFLRTGRLDIALPPIDQGFRAEAHDVVIAANVLHATPDLGRSLDHAAQLLAPGGLLVLQEWTGSVAALDLIFGLTQGWWRFADRDVRASHPLISAKRWRTLLDRHGFEDVATIGSAPGDRGALAKQAVIVARKKVAGGRCIVLGNPDGAGARVRAALAARGKDAQLVATPETAAGLLTGGAGGRPVADIIDLRALDAPPARDLSPSTVQRTAERVSSDLARLVQSLARSASSGCRLHIVTRGALSIDSEPADGVAQAPAWGVGKVISLEHPELSARLIDLDAAADPAPAVADALERDVAETQRAIRGGRRFAPRLIPHRPAHAPAPIRFDGDAAYVVTGGFGGLGLVVADWLASKGAGLVVLTGRRAPSAAAMDAIRAIERRGSRLLVRQMDVAVLDQVTTVLDEVREGGTRIAGVFHAAGVLDDGALLQMDEERLTRVLAPKVQGTWSLHEATRGDRLDAFVLFSAATSMFGSAGQANHAAANAFLDAFAAYRKAAGLPALSINWGAWARVGAASGAGLAERVRMKGLRAIEPAHGLAILERLMQGRTAQVGAFAVDWDAIPAVMKAVPFLQALVEASPAPKPAAPALATELRDAPAHRRRPALAAHVRAEIRRVLGFADSAPVDMKQGLFDLGFDSLTSMDLRNRLQESCGCALAATLAFDYPTPDAIVTHLLALLPAPGPSTPEGDVADLLGRKLAELRESQGS